MKQHITKEQWDELDEKQKDMFCKQQGVDKDLCVLIYVDVNIGQMIEFLQREHAVKCDQWMDEYRAWRVGLDWMSGDDYVYVCEQPELCDALWMAVKYKLEQFVIN